MRRILIILLYFCAASSLKAQTSPKSNDASSDTYCYDLNGNKITGIITKNDGENWFIYRDYKGAKKEKIYASMVKSLVCVPDSFVVTHVIYPEDPQFLKVLVDENIKLYEYSELKNYSNGVYIRGGFKSFATGYMGFKLFYGPNPEHITQIKGRNFIDAMKIVFANQPELLKKILDKEYEYDDMESIVNYYNGMKFEAARKKSQQTASGK